MSGYCKDCGNQHCICDDVKNFRENNEWLKDYIEELKEILELDEFPDLESKFTFAEYLGSCEEWLKNGTPVKSAPCSLCGGDGKLHDYEDEWPCHSCFGTGVSVYPA